MTIPIIFLCAVISFGWMFILFVIWTVASKARHKCLSAIIAVILIVSTFLCGWLYQNKTASGRRQLVDQKSNFNNGLERIITIYTANGDRIAQYEGKIDIASADGYVKFDFDGKRYIYYNCFVECVADLSE